MTIHELISEAYGNAVKKGFHEDPPDIPRMLCLVHSEISEALESYRSGNHGRRIASVFRVDRKPDGFAIELADAVIRIADLAGALGIDLQDAVAQKLTYNRGRAHKHGKAF